MPQALQLLCDTEQFLTQALEFGFPWLFDAGAAGLCRGGKAILQTVVILNVPVSALSSRPKPFRCWPQS
jgi:hypothetical protein